MRWWKDIHAALRGIPHAIGGGVAANQYRPPRHTADVDFMVRLRDLPAAEDAARKAGWKWTATLRLEGGLKGSAWERDGNELDLIGVPGALGHDAINAARRNYRNGLPYLTLRHVVALKMIPNRTQALADIATMLGHASPAQIRSVRAAVKRFLGPDDVADLDQMVEMGRLERG